MDLTSLDNVIASEWKISGNVLIEKQKGHAMKATISTKGQCLLCKFEKDGEIAMPYLSKHRGVRKICDYVLFTIKEETLYVLLFELKEGSGKPLEQFKATELLSRYIVATANRIFGSPYEGKTEYRRICVINKSVKKKVPPSIYSEHYYKKVSAKSAIDISRLCV